MDYLTADQVGSDLGVTPKTVREWLKNGDLVGIKLGGSWRIHKKDVWRFVSQKRLQALLEKAKASAPDWNWEEGQCDSCYDVMPVPISAGRWVCSVECKIQNDRRWAEIVGEESDNHIFNLSKVIPNF